MDLVPPIEEPESMRYKLLKRPLGAAGISPSPDRNVAERMGSRVLGRPPAEALSQWRVGTEHQQEVGGADIVEELQGAGLHVAAWDGQGLPSLPEQRNDQLDLWGQIRGGKEQSSASEQFFATGLSGGEDEEMELVGGGHHGDSQRAEQRQGVKLRAPTFVPPTVSSGALGAPPAPFITKDWQDFVRDQRMKTPMRAASNSARRRVIQEEEQVERQHKAGPEEQQHDAGLHWARGPQGEQARGSPQQPATMQGPDAAHTQRQIADVLTLLTDRLTRAPVQQNPPPQQAQGLKLPALQLPAIKTNSSGDVPVREFFSWKHSLSTIIKNHKLSPEALLVYYASSPKLVPESFIRVFQNSTSLAEAIASLDMMFAPLSTIKADLVKEMCDMPPMENSTDGAKIHRIGRLLSCLEDYIRFFGGNPTKNRNFAVTYISKPSNIGKRRNICKRSDISKLSKIIH